VLRFARPPTAFEALVAALDGVAHAPAKAETKPKRTTTGRKKPTAKAPGKGKMGATERVQSLIDEGWFAEEQSSGGVRTRLQTDGHTFARQTISTTLLRLAQAKKLKRTGKPRSYRYVNP
jgi:hypothetical protein